MPLPHNRHTPDETHLCKETQVVALGVGTVITTAEQSIDSIAQEIMQRIHISF